ncbi:sulfotransferase 2A1-like [Callospermophilus lateralis]|uniref:sulfotransferase 2A1-like n=1 Tax=Callospermophilus lateralis TaxID=76772 RepID=UPI00403899A0
MTDGYLWFEGICFPVIGFSSEVLKEAGAQFVIKDEDTVLVTYPKSGTNWLVEILCLIHSHGDTKWIRSVPFWERSPWIETDVGYTLLNERGGPRLMSSHLPFHLFPKSLFTSKPKIRCHGQIREEEMSYGSWFEHIRGWMSMRHRENVLLLSYEELQKDPRSAIERICQFLGKKLSPEELDSVLKNSSFLTQFLSAFSQTNTRAPTVTIMGPLDGRVLDYEKLLVPESPGH